MLYIVRGLQGASRRTNNALVAMGYAEASCHTSEQQSHSEIAVYDDSETDLQDYLIYKPGLGWFRIIPDKDSTKMFADWYDRDKAGETTAKE